MASTTARPTPSALPSPAKSKKEKVRVEKGKDKERKEKAPQHTERLKTVVRKLPPNLPEEIFWQSVQLWVADDTVSWKTYFPGKLRFGLNKENVPSRAYIAFKNEEQLALFSREYDGHLFRDKSGKPSFRAIQVFHSYRCTGHESQAVVEFAPYQKVPSEKKKIDPRNGTIEKDENYISFIESLNASAKPELVSIETLIASTQPVPQPKTTPLLEALKAEKNAIKEKAAIKEKVAIMRNAAHETARKEDAARKKGGKTLGELAASPSAPPAPSNKKPNKKSMSNVNNTSGPASTPGAGGPPVKFSGPPSKASKATRQQSSQPPSQPLTQPPPKVSTAQPPSVSQPQSQEAAPSAAPSRRTRPILGLASRQFEAALSGAGVNAGERKSRKEREKERQAPAANKEREKDQASGKDAPSTPANVANNTTSGPTSPKRDRDRGSGKRKSSVSSNGGAPVATVSKVPSILQRTLATDTSGPTTPAIFQRGGDESVLGPSPSVEASPVARGGRRGRGRGRGGGGGGPTPITTTTGGSG
ncbi:Smg-4/UPF3 family-domain-containing protein [Lentinula guzmanii]|uniref:Smg-4/UPF3 family-domain-containing protein n=1 Tax=Lentinula guzmanii TaxID=2804957 RepID=A0AA38JGF0_9AGAR|nr:Smg-4/UPF3 family-domain-containing protein [Lentinula guzmanii]